MVELLRVDPASEVLWGKLVRSWATGVNHIAAGQPAPRVPETLSDLRQQCRDAGISINIPAQITQFRVVVMPRDTLVLRLPAKELVEGIEADLRKDGAPYPIAKFYDDAYGIDLEVANPDERVKLQSCRIGEYSISYCG